MDADSLQDISQLSMPQARNPAILSNPGVHECVWLFMIAEPDTVDAQGEVCVSHEFDLAGTEHSTILQPASARHLASVELGGSPAPGAYQETASL